MNACGSPAAAAAALRDAARSAMKPSVPVVERLEVVEVGVAHGELLVARRPGGDLFVDAVVAGEAGQRRDRAHLGVTSKRGMHARDEFQGVERLDDVVVRSRSQPDDLVRRQALRRQHDDGEARGERIGAQPATQLNAVDARHHHVEQYEVRHALADDLQGFLAVVSDEHIEALEPQVDLDEAGDVDVIVDDEHGAHACAHQAESATADADCRSRRTTSAGSSAP